MSSEILPVLSECRILSFAYGDIPPCNWLTVCLYNIMTQFRIECIEMRDSILLRFSCAWLPLCLMVKIQKFRNKII